jgi:two-component system invasion response regulator UvrY
MKETKNIRVHIADDHQVLIDGIEAVLKIEPKITVVGTSVNGLQVLEWFEENIADVLILDINMPKLDGIEVLKALKKKEISTKPIVLSSYEDIKLVRKVLNLGALGFLGKNCAAEQIVKAILSVAEGEEYFSKSVLQEMLSFVGIKERLTARPDGYYERPLSERELEILKYVSCEMNSKEIGNILNISPSTVETYRKKLLKKLDVKNSVGMVMYAIKHKLI